MDPIHLLIDGKTELYSLAGTFKANKQSSTPERETQNLKLRKRASKRERQAGWWADIAACLYDLDPAVDREGR